MLSDLVELPLLLVPIVTSGFASHVFAKSTLVNRDTGCRSEVCGLHPQSSTSNESGE